MNNICNHCSQVRIKCECYNTVNIIPPSFTITLFITVKHNNGLLFGVYKYVAIAGMVYIAEFVIVTNSVSGIIIP